MGAQLWIRHDTLAQREANSTNVENITAMTNVWVVCLAFAPHMTPAHQDGRLDMRRQKTTGGLPMPSPPVGNWLAGAFIGATIVTVAVRAMILGAGAANRDATLKGG